MPRWQSCNKTVLMPCCWRNGCCAWYLGTKKSCWYVRWFHGDFNKISQDWTIICRVCRWFMLLYGFLRIFSQGAPGAKWPSVWEGFFHTGFNHRNVEVWPANIWEMGISDSQIYGFQQQNWDVFICVHWTPVMYSSYSDSIGWPHHPFDSWEGSTDHDMVNESDDGKNYQTPL